MMKYFIVNQKEGPIEAIVKVTFGHKPIDPPIITNLDNCFDFRPLLMSDFALMS